MSWHSVGNCRMQYGRIQWKKLSNLAKKRTHVRGTIECFSKQMFVVKTQICFRNIHMFPKTYKSFGKQRNITCHLFASRIPVGLLKNKENPRRHCSKETQQKERRKVHKILTQVSVSAKKAHFRLRK